MIQLIKNYFIKRRRIRVATKVLNHKYLNNENATFSLGICRILKNLGIIRETEFKRDLFKFYLYAYGNNLHNTYYPYWFSPNKEGDEKRKELLIDYIRYNKENKTY
jgi:hypothetical protein